MTSIYECQSAGVDFLFNGLAPLAGSVGDCARRHHKALALTGLFRNLLSLSASSEGYIVDESVICQFKDRQRYQTVTAPIDCAGRGLPVVNSLLIDSSSVATPVTVVCPTPSGYTDTYSFRWRNVTQTIDLHYFPHRFDRLAA